MTSPESGEYSGKQELAQLEALHAYNDYVGSILGAPFANGARVADFGAGRGTVCDRLRSRLDVVAVEIDPELQSVLAAKGYAVHTDLDDLEAHSLDGVYSSNVLEHIDDDVRILRSMVRAVRSGGAITLFLPALPMLWTHLDDRVGHVRRYSWAELRDKLLSVGLVVEDQRYADSLGGALALLFKVIGPSSGEVSQFQLKVFDRLVFPASRLMDIFCWRFFGKNLYVVARVPES